MAVGTRVRPDREAGGGVANRGGPHLRTTGESEAGHGEDTHGVGPEPGQWTGIAEQTRDPTFETVRIRYVIDEVVMRTVAKIAFNYLAYVTEELVPGFVRREEFATIRAFIRHGTRPSWNLVGVGSATTDLGDTR